MAISTTGRAVKAKTKEYLRTKRTIPAGISDYNHLRVQFSDGSERHLLFTDFQVVRGLNRSNINKDLGELPKITWIHEVWYEGVVENNANDIASVISKKNLPRVAKKINHIRLSVDGSEHHLWFTNNEIRNALQRAEQLKEKLPKTSYVGSDIME